MAIEAYTDHYTGGAGGFVPGKCYIKLVEVDENGGKNGQSLVLTYECLDSDLEENVGERHQDFFSKTPKSMWRIHVAAIAFGLTTEDEVQQAKAANKGMVYDFPANGIGKTAFCEGVEEVFENKPATKIDGRLYPVDAKRCMNWKCNPNRDSSGDSSDAAKSEKTSNTNDPGGLLDGVF